MTDVPDFMKIAKESSAESAARKYRFKQVVKSKGLENGQGWHTNIDDMKKWSNGFVENAINVCTIIYHPEKGFVALMAYEKEEDIRACSAYFSFINIGEWPLLRESDKPETPKIDYMAAVHEIVGRKV